MRGRTITLDMGKGWVGQPERLYQYDYGQRLIITGIELPPAYEVHFSNQERGASKTSIGDSTGVDIPDEFLLNGKNIHVWLYLHDSASDGETEYHGIIAVEKRAQPTDQAPTPVQQSVIDQAIAALNAGVTEVEGIAEGIPSTIDAALQEAKDSGEFDGAPGEDGFSPTATVVKEGHVATITITDKDGTTTAEIRDGEDGGGGVSDYELLTNKPRIAGVTLNGNKSLADLGAASASALNDKADKTDTILNTTLSRGRKANTTVGIASYAFGNNVTASGNYSHAEGLGSSASGNESHAEGDYTNAVGHYSHAEGGGTFAGGESSHAEGINTLASGNGSHAEGNDNLASGNYAHVEGSGNTATNGCAHAEGNSTQAEGYCSHAEGSNTEATNEAAHAEGYQSRASGYYSHAEGGSTIASGIGSHAEGGSTTASGERSHAEGRSTKATGAYSHAEGYGTTNKGALGKADHAEGYQTLANSGSANNDYGAHAEGQLTQATSGSAHAEGFQTTASGYSSHAEGSETTASGYSSHAEGSQTTASGSYSHSEGINTIAAGYYSHAEGNYTKAAGYYSHAEGHYTIAEGYYQHVSGSRNVVDDLNFVVVPSLADAEEYDTSRELYPEGSVVKVGDTLWVAHGTAIVKLASPEFDTINWHTYTGTPTGNEPEWEPGIYAVNSIVKVTKAIPTGTVAAYYQNHNAIESPYITPGVAPYGTTHWHSQTAGSYYVTNKRKHAEIVGDGALYSGGRNIRSLDWDGNEHLAGDVYVGCNIDSTGGSKVLSVAMVATTTETQAIISEYGVSA